MTKLKNTKKGMAKKALSISLVAAMLATSNVPVWAAEDLFTDGSAAVEAEAVEDTDIFTEAPAEDVAPAAEVEEIADGIELQTAADYTVETNVELKTADGSWASVLQLAKKDGATGDMSLDIYKGNTKINPAKIEVYYNNDLQNPETPITVTSLAAINEKLATIAPGVEAYKGGKAVAVKVYVDGEKEAVATFSYTLKAVNITGRSDFTYTSETKPYNGSAQYPTGVQIGGTATQAGGKITVGYEKATDGINVGDYYFYAEGVEAEGYVGKTASSADAEGGAKAFTIAPVQVSKDNLNIAVSGDVSFNSAAQAPASVVVTDKATGAVLPKELYTVAAAGNTAVGTYESAVKTADGTKYPLGVSVTLNANNGKTGDELVKNNFMNADGAAITDNEIITGSYAITKLDLTALTAKYDITVKPQVKTADNKYDIKTTGLIIKDKVTGEEVSTTSVLPSTVTAAPVVLAAGATSGTVSFTSTDALNVTGTLSLPFNVVGAEITADKVYLPKGTKINNVDVCPTAKTALNDATLEGKIKAALAVTFDGSAKEPLKDVFGTLVQAGNNVDQTDVKYIYGTDYDVIYTNNTNSDAAKAISKEGKAKVTLRFKGNYTGEISYEFAISQADVTATAKPLSYQAGVSSYEANADLTIGSGTNKKDIPAAAYVRTAVTKATKQGETAVTTYELKDKNYKWAAAQGAGISVDATGKIATVTVAVAGKSLKDTSVSAQVTGTYTYTGKAIVPTIEVKDGAIVLKEGTDYKIVSKSGTEAGEASVTIEGMGSYSEQLMLKYTIAKAELKDAAILSSKANTDTDKTKETNYDQPYNGQAQGPDIKTIKIGDKELAAYDEAKKTGDYIITFDENAKEVGTYNYTITAAASSTKVQGTISGTYKVTPAKMSAQFVKKSNPSYSDGKEILMTPNAYYTGKAITLDDLKTRYVVVNAQSVVLTEGKDYRLEYENNTDAGRATVYAYGLGNYAYVEDGKEVAIASANFIIEGEDIITSANIKAIADVEYAGGLNVEPQVTVKIGNKTLVQGIDYTVKVGGYDETENLFPITTVGKYESDYVSVIGKGAYTAGNLANQGIHNSGLADWNVVKKDMKNTIIAVDGEEVTVMNGTVLVSSSDYDVKFSEDKKTVTVTAKADSKNYTGTQEVAVTDVSVGTAVIADVKVVGNKATVILEDEADKAVGYDYVISTANDYKNGRVSINKNELVTQTSFQYLDKGVYYAYLHAWKRVDGKKVFGGWSNLYRFEVGTTTPSQPAITSVKVSGKNVTVTYTKSADATGYDLVLGSAVKKVNGEQRPVSYGKLVKKVTNGNTVKATFTNVPKGTYYAGLHAYNRTSVNNTKVFSPWSTAKKLTVK